MNNLSQNIVDNTINHKCSCCGSCCSLLIPFTEKELQTVKKYVKQHNIKPIPRINLVTNTMKANCCFYDDKNHKCLVYEVRPYVCKDFKCDHKDWLQRRDRYEARAKYNSSINKKYIIGTFDDLIYQDYTYIVRYIMDIISSHYEQPTAESLINFLKFVNRLDVLDYITLVDENGKKYNKEDLKNEILS